ncbi:MAG: chemotaxis protein CheD [Lachnospiraceae bacterium]|nr:chemotaxis protein CheD [Candidatus Merdinaster equi]
MADIVKVGMADLKVCKAPDGLTTLGLGSCVGVAVRDPSTKVGGLAHVMLPDSTTISQNGNKMKFADTGIQLLVEEMIKLGANKSRLVAKIAGGAQMFAMQNKSDLVQVGKRNVDACKKKLAELKIPILAEDTGNNYGRTVIYYPETGDFVIKAVGKNERTI